MAVEITYNSNLLSVYQTYYNANKVALTESLAWLILDEQRQGSSEEDSTLVFHLASFYLNAIATIHQAIDADWTHLDWLTEDEYNEILKRIALQ